jgi:hypothetical protein
MRRKALGASKASHKQFAVHDMQEARRRLEAASKAVKAGKCTTAYMNVVEMWHALGRAQAEGERAGSTASKPSSDIEELGYQFSTLCLRDTPAVLDGAKRRPRRRKRA